MPGLKLSSNNDKKAFKDILNNYYQPLCHLSNYYLENTDEATGVVQEAFIKLWEVRHELNPDSHLQNFLFTLEKKQLSEHSEAQADFTQTS